MFCSQRGPELAGKTKFADSTTHFKHETLVKHNNGVEQKLCRDPCNGGAKAPLQRVKISESAEEAEMTIKFNTAHHRAREEVPSTAIPGNI